MTQAWNINTSSRVQLPHASHPDEGHTAQVYVLHLRDSTIVSGSADKTIRIWDTRTQRLVREPLTGHEGSIVCLRFDDRSDQDVIISGSVDGSIIVWQFSTGNIVTRVQNAHAGTVLSLAFNDRFLVTGGKDGAVKLWNRQPLKDTTALPERLCPNVGSANSAVAAYTVLATLREQGPAKNRVVLRDNHVLAGAGDGTVEVWDLNNRQPAHKIDSQNSRGICDLEYHGKYIILGSGDKTCRVYDLAQQAEVACLRGHREMVRAVGCVPGAEPALRDIVTAGYDGDVRYWRNRGEGQWECETVLDCSGFKPVGGGNNADSQGEEKSRRILDIELDGTRLYCAGEGPIIKIWDFGGAAI